MADAGQGESGESGAEDRRGSVAVQSGGGAAAGGEATIKQEGRQRGNE